MSFKTLILITLISCCFSLKNLSQSVINKEMDKNKEKEQISEIFKTIIECVKAIDHIVTKRTKKEKSEAFENFLYHHDRLFFLLSDADENVVEKSYQLFEKLTRVLNKSSKKN
jgi:hypothetical protein